MKRPGESEKLDLRKIRKEFLAGERVAPPRLLDRLQRDPRRCAQTLYQSLSKRRSRHKAEANRIRRLQQKERALQRMGWARIAGVDEVGVGPLAGPVVAAAVLFSTMPLIRGVTDSKQLSPEKRHSLERKIRDQALCVGVGLASVVEIHELNVFQASLLAMQRAVRALDKPPDYVLVDARTIPDLEIPQTAVKKGDQKHFSISAASIVAKNFRDRLMAKLHRRYPAYGFDTHMGYCTKGHIDAIRRHGLCPEHRSSYQSLQALTSGPTATFLRLCREIDGCQSLDNAGQIRYELQQSLDVHSFELKTLHQRIRRKIRSLRAQSQPSLF